MAASQPLTAARHRSLNGWQLSKLHTFEVAARHESFAKAADELSLTPSAVSHSINQIEAQLGIQLFVRSHRKVELTAEGKRLFWALQSSLQSLSQEILDIKNQALSGNLTVYSRPSIAQAWIVPSLADFSRRFPAINLSLLTGNDYVNFHRASIDLAVYFDATPSPQLHHQHLMDETIIPVCSPGYARQFDLEGKPGRLARCTLLHDQQAWSYDSGTDEWHGWAQHFGVSLDVSTGLGFDRSDLAVLAATSHAGVAMGRRRLVRRLLDSRQLITPFPDMELKCEQHYYVCTLSDRQWPKIEAFTRWLQALASS
ncbi:DNA-binding transcriptional regulator DsdC [Corticibacter populi]|uniref:DNA-binding transcriptional regulator DsdC n=1 Tax=Corticibacter populi TaxID=1550736 RepID=A0A3M6QV69_9BURK|nr:DNA-binding transcriptional regulator DsdC [Corticibacter populi]RMX06459.1 DNA-binding transcriptional regulator DsdC [Corticibacter populi]RZS31985.1 LysR family D-serine deaminase transcriptional activator [Corticibacter populi]